MAAVVVLFDLIMVTATPAASAGALRKMAGSRGGFGTRIAGTRAGRVFRGMLLCCRLVRHEVRRSEMEGNECAICE